MSTILVVDDNDDIRDLLTRKMKSHGYTVATACDGVEAVKVASSSDLALILMDINLPELDGLEATMQIRAGRAGDTDKHTPVIALTAYALPDDQSRAKAAGCDAFHAKPIDFDRLFDQISELIGEVHTESTTD
ncbi:response regulator [Allorhodopirellula heiligendammensis]|uniref:Polar-differentiation response regulator DivK n=1 Tax=Allorhodopirellula heiligendammensis TaxID=2714739 RepID=A0A5C6BWD6_9BACT|nr:response regulator [Allorhodopirellula heiligendammensis]TWU15556.1 Polar-differentiation response regulator DivK [Allorhodopirellula heiligendammensis]